MPSRSNNSRVAGTIELAGLLSVDRTRACDTFRRSLDYEADGAIAPTRCMTVSDVELIVVHRGLIAQLAERVADNDEVPGSSPGGPIDVTS